MAILRRHVGLCSIAMRVASNQRDGTQLRHVTVDGLAEWIAWWEAREASA